MRGILALFLLLSLSQVFCDEADVLVLTDSNFDELVNPSDLMLVEFYAPWCGHCKKLAPAWEEAAGTLKKNDPPISIAKVDCTTETKVAGRFGITGYPTIKVFRNGVASDYKGGRDAGAIVSYMKKNVGPSAKALNTVEDAKKFVNHFGDISVVGVFPTKNAAADEFLKAANSLREDFRLGYVTDQSVADALGVSNGGVAVFRSSEKAEVFPGSGSLTDWIWDSSVEYPAEITKDNAQRFLRKNLPIVKLFTDVNWKSNHKQATYWINRLKKLAEDFKGKLLFTIADRVGHSEDLQKFGITTFPGFAIDDSANSQRYRHEGEFTVASGLQFLKDFVEGKLKSYIKSEPTPDQTGPVTIITGNNFKDIVLDDKKDVLLEMYAPWCGHCKNLVPVYDELATNLKDVDNLVIAKMDATANDSPHGKYQAKGYPTILFAPAGSKDAPVAYSGARDVKSFTEFLKRESKNSNFDNASATKSEL